MPRKRIFFVLFYCELIFDDDFIVRFSSIEMENIGSSFLNTVAAKRQAIIKHNKTTTKNRCVNGEGNSSPHIIKTNNGHTKHTNGILV